MQLILRRNTWYEGTFKAWSVCYDELWLVCGINFGLFVCDMYRLAFRNTPPPPWADPPKTGPNEKSSDQKLVYGIKKLSNFSAQNSLWFLRSWHSFFMPFTTSSTIEAFDLRDNESDEKMTTSKHSIAIISFESAWKNLRNIKSKPKALIVSFEVPSKFVFNA
jgi:hypothetical protein